MINWQVLLVLSLGYVVVLFAIAYWGDTADSRRFSRFGRSVIYSLTLAVYCTSWTFYGAVGTAAENGWGYLPIYVGPMLVILFGWPLINRIVTISKRQNLTSIADFISARYGKAQSLAALVTVIATIGSVPYIALQLKAIVSGFNIVSDYPASGGSGYDAALVVAAALAVFAILFGTRKIDVTEHHEGMMLAIAFESIVKLLAFVAVGLFALFLLGSLGDGSSMSSPSDAVFKPDHLPDAFVTQLILASAAIFCLPRQFHVAIVEAHKDANIRMARWTFPLYLLVFMVFIVPIALAGLRYLSPGEFSGDVFVLALPLQAGSDWLTILAFLGGFSAATSMVIVACVALSTMISNELVMPALLQIKALGLSERADYSQLLLAIRRGAIIGISLLGYLYYLVTDESAALASIGLLSFAAAAQFMPLIVLGLYWRRATRAGAIAGLTTGFVLWAFTLFLPTLARSGLFSADFVEFGVFGWSWLRPEALLVDLQANPLTHGVAWSLMGNIAVLVAVSSLTRQSMIEKIQARAFASPIVVGRAMQPSATGSDLTNADLRALADRFLGEAHAKRSFDDFMMQQGIDLAPSLRADRRLLQFTERLLSGAIGAASARIVISTALRKTGMEIGDVVLLLDETSHAVRFNRQLTEATLENISQGVSVVDTDLRLIGWNSRYLELMSYPEGMVHVGESIEDLMVYNAKLGRFGNGDVQQEVAKRLQHLRDGTAYRYESNFIDGKVIEIRGQPMLDGGFVTTYTDITDFKRAEAALVDAKQLLEQRVADRTAELERTMAALQAAKATAEEANVSKTRFLAAAAHDLLQPLNAAKLFAALLGEHRTEMTDEQSKLVARVESGLLSVEDLLSALLDISRLDTAAPEPKRENLSVAELFDALEAQFAETFAEQGLRLRFAKTDLAVYSDPALLRRILQNFISNARRYTRKGGVLIGCRRRNGSIALQVIDTGVGIAESDQKAVFEEFHRLSDGTEHTKRGLGLGLAIVDRIARLLGHEISLRSELGKGSCFEVFVPRADKAHVARAIPKSPKQRVASPIDGQIVLCVDNETEILAGMKGLIGKWGAAPVTASSPREAAAAADRIFAERGQWPDLLLVDYHLNDHVTGLDVIDDLRNKALRNVPAVILTADHSQTVADLVGEAGITLLRKPVKPAALRALVNRILSRQVAD
ncbi:MAG: hybrid sensor histidine kinase/response regulator [Gammaproteobacteria bacterium]|nr:hybrid sensor histidine kinase/response regulator [Gammaproteobacteria bacterium]MBT8093442.1 hybrid sensor histidine kinase/response regulator [Gammaproteobacteria bacterium]MBT8104834.1 hybrid sensor histidine kinase/response regulator [Gammaproteobacteria bacterium]NNF49988.1 hybrid sensor histidine kinase/response regulator [Woeseiaceae bacterium]NNK24848.1 hybrid sensor histidine kinase/response regulator [Woeseiaceae bacterium]